jgi:hypothetical protein
MTSPVLSMSVKKREICVFYIHIYVEHMRGFCDCQQIYFQIGRIYTFAALLNTGKWICTAASLAA